MVPGMVRLREAVLGRSAARGALLGAALGAAAWSGCTTNHDALARRPDAGNPAGGGAGGAGGGGFGNTGNRPGQGGRMNPDFEPPGDDVLTIVNGVVDAAAVQLCFARLDETGASSELLGSPTAELPYAGSIFVTELEGLSFSDDAIQPWLLAGESSLLEGLDCEAAVALALEEEAKVTPVAAWLDQEGVGGQPSGAAGDETAGGASSGGVGGAAAGESAGGEPTGGQGAGGSGPSGPPEVPALRARPLSALPPGTLSIGRSILLVMSGCMGGAAYFDTVDTAVCGDEYTPETPTLAPVVVKLSRAISFSAVGLQGVQASQAVGSVDLRVAGDDGAVALTFARNVSFGGIEPRPADTRFGPAELGVTRRNYGLQAADGTGVVFQAAWSDVLEVSGLDAVVAARSYTAVLVGPSPLLIKRGWWNDAAFVLVDNDPTRD